MPTAELKRELFPAWGDDAWRLAGFGQCQQHLLRLLLENKAGLTIKALMRALAVSKPAVHQHLIALERGGYVMQKEQRKTGGRPSRVYALTERGVHLFPKQYAWFSRLLLKQLLQELGSVPVQSLLYRLGQETAASVRLRLQGLSPAECLKEIVQLMQELGYEARLEGEVIAACNCVYHDLAKEHPEVCALDLGLLDGLLGEQVVQTECMLRGGKACRFCLHRTKAKNATSCESKKSG
ncbi:MAG: helix-turn-helix domain-containing protein [Methylohalobius sp.]|nr:helix-turn-helix domain-containing protein [Methylohalobius sp.]